jgi:hypothetical protein
MTLLARTAAVGLKAFHASLWDFKLTASSPGMSFQAPVVS